MGGPWKDHPPPSPDRRFVGCAQGSCKGREELLGEATDLLRQAKSLLRGHGIEGRIEDLLDRVRTREVESRP